MASGPPIISWNKFKKRQETGASSNPSRRKQIPLPFRSTMAEAIASRSFESSQGMRSCK